MGYDAFAVVNPDYWEDGADINKFTGWMNFTEVSAEVLPLLLLMLTCDIIVARSGEPEQVSKMVACGQPQQPVSPLEGDP